MTRRTIILRETLLSMAINAAISAVFFFALFGLARPVPAAAFARDFLPQSFMVALMGTLVPGLLLRRVHGGSVRGVVTRAFMLAGAALIAGVIVFAMLRTGGPVAAIPALAIKLAYSLVLSAIVTPFAVRAVLTGSPKVIA